MKAKNRKRLYHVSKYLQNVCEALEEISNDEKETDPAASEQILMYKDYIQTQMEELNEFIEE